MTWTSSLGPQDLMWKDSGSERTALLVGRSVNHLEQGVMCVISGLPERRKPVNSMRI